MNKVAAFKLSLIITIVFNLLDTYFKIAHYSYGTTLLWISFVASLIFIILGLLDVFRNDNRKLGEKLMWAVGFIFLSWLAGLLYFPKFKREIKILQLTIFNNYEL